MLRQITIFIQKLDEGYFSHFLRQGPKLLLYIKLTTKFVIWIMDVFIKKLDVEQCQSRIW